MSNALLAGVSGLTAHQKMLDVVGNNLANIDTLGFKTSRVTFSELLNETLKEATRPTPEVGGTNPAQIGSGVGVASIDRNMGQGNLENTGQPLDMAIDGAGFFVLSDGQRDLFTRVGAFAVDAAYYLVDPATGYRVQRIGSEGVAEAFQNPASGDIRVPYDMALPAKATETINFTGNLSSDASSPTQAIMTSGTAFTVNGAVVSKTTKLLDLDDSTAVAGEEIRVHGKTKDGTDVDADFTIQAASTIEDLLDFITTQFGGAGTTGSTASLVNGEIRLADNEAGYSQTDLYTDYTGAGAFPLPQYFKMTSPGGNETRTTNVEIYDAQGVSHVATVAFIRKDDPALPNAWDVVLMSMMGDVRVEKRRVSDITFGTDGSFSGMGGASPDTPNFDVRYGSDLGNLHSLMLNMGTVAQFDGLAQFGGPSTAAASTQDGYGAGWLSSLSVSREGVLEGMFTNGIRSQIAALKLATFQNPAGLQSAGSGYYAASGNSGDPMLAKALTAGAGSIRGASLEKSNVDVAAEFVNLIQAQNGYQANARTIRVANDMLKELANLIR